MKDTCSTHKDLCEDKFPNECNKCCMYVGKLSKNMPCAEWLLKEVGGCNFKKYDLSPLKIHLASYPGSSPAEKREESLEDLITCPVTYYAWF